MPSIPQISPFTLPVVRRGKIENAATVAETDFNVTVRQVFVTGLKSMREGIAGCYLFHKSHTSEAIMKMLEAAGQEHKRNKGELYSPLFTYVAQDIKDDVSDVSVWATHRANCCRRLMQLEPEANPKHFKNTSALAAFIKSQGGMVKLAEAYKASQENTDTSNPTSNDNESDGQVLLHAAARRLPHFDTGYALPSGSSEFFVLLAERDAKGNASILGTLPKDPDDLTFEIERLLQGNAAAILDEVVNLHRLVRLSEIFGTEQLLVSAKGKAALIPQTRTDQNHKNTENTARIFVSINTALPVSGEIKAAEFKKLRKALKSLDKLYRYALSSNTGGSRLIVNTGNAETEIAVEPIRKAVTRLVKPKTDTVAAEFSLPIKYLADVADAQEAKASQTSKIVVTKDTFRVGRISLKVVTNTSKKVEVRQDLLTKTFRALAELSEESVTVRLYEGLADISFHLADALGDFAVEFAGFEED